MKTLILLALALAACYDPADLDSRVEVPVGDTSSLVPDRWLTVGEGSRRWVLADLADDLTPGTGAVREILASVYWDEVRSPPGTSRDDHRFWAVTWAGHLTPLATVDAEIGFTAGDGRALVGAVAHGKTLSGLPAWRGLAIQLSAGPLYPLATYSRAPIVPLSRWWCQRRGSTLADCVPWRTAIEIGEVLCWGAHGEAGAPFQIDPRVCLASFAPVPILAYQFVLDVVLPGGHDGVELD